MWEYNNLNELYHYGIKGMKWGVHRKRPGYITARQSFRNARAAAETARKESIAADRERLSGIGSFRKMNQNAIKAKQKAYEESIAKDKAYNKQLRSKAIEKGKKTVERLLSSFNTVAGGPKPYDYSKIPGDVAGGPKKKRDR